MSVMLPTTGASASARAQTHGHKAAAHSSTGSDKGTVSKRLQQELMQLMSSGNPHVSAFPEGDSLLTWTGTIAGPPDSPFAGLAFRLRLTFPADYPFAAPSVCFTQPGLPWHPNVDTVGNICVDFLKDKWSAAYSVYTLLLSLQALLADPYTSSPLNPSAAGDWPASGAPGDVAAYRSIVLRKYKETGGSPPAE